jgi:transporter family protein
LDLWLGLGLISVVLLGIYDLAKKLSLQGNPVIPVLLAANLCGVFWVVGAWALGFLELIPFSWSEHLAVIGKALLVNASWMAGYYGLRHLPLSVASPLRASQPFWTVFGAFLLFSEMPKPLQWLGIALILGSYVWMALAGKKQSAVSWRSPWVACMFLAAILGACSGFLDKILLQDMQMDPWTLQFWFAVHLAWLMLIPWGLWWLNQRRLLKPVSTEDSSLVPPSFRWRWSIPAIAFLLLAADFAYFRALAEPEALLSVLSPLRRGAVVVSFALGIFVLREGNVRSKIVPLCWIVLGTVLLVVGF